MNAADHGYEDDPKIPKPLSPEERAALTSGRISGRSSLKQQEYLAKLGVPRSKTVTWTKYRAHKEITRRTTRPSQGTHRSGGAKTDCRSGRKPGGDPRQTGTLAADTQAANSQRPQKGPPSGSSPEKSSIYAEPSLEDSAATPCSELHGGRGNHQNAPQVNSTTEKAPAPGY